MSLICFDLGNTLIYSSKAHLYAFKKAFQKIKDKDILKVFSLESSILIKTLYPNISKNQVKK